MEGYKDRKTIEREGEKERERGREGEREGEREGGREKSRRIMTAVASPKGMPIRAVQGRNIGPYRLQQFVLVMILNRTRINYS